jgi:hypothetical protein
MFAFIPSAQMLDPQARKALQKGELTLDQVREIQTEVKSHRQNMRKGFHRALIIAIGVFLVLTAVSIPQMGASAALLFSTFFMGGALALILLLVKYFYVDAVQRQFVRAVTKGYPNFVFEL